MRPEGWDAALLAKLKEIPDTELLQGDVVKALMLFAKAGADAMLEALKDDGVFTYGHHTPDIYLEDARCENGYWVFIEGDCE